MRREMRRRRKGREGLGQKGQKDLSRTSKNDRNEEVGGRRGRASRGGLKRISAAIGRRGFPNNATERAGRTRFSGGLVDGDRDSATRERAKEEKKSNESSF